MNVLTDDIFVLPRAKSFQEASLQASVWERAQTLFLPGGDGSATDRGYEAIYETDGVFSVGKPRPAGDYTEEYGGPYQVNLVAQSCTCPFYVRHRYCKHVLGLAWWRRYGMAVDSVTRRVTFINPPVFVPESRK